MSFVDEVNSKKVLVFGLGLQGGGVGDALWLYCHGAKVKVTDLKSAQQLQTSLHKLPSDISLTLGKHLDEDIHWADIIIQNPGVPSTQPQLQLAKQLNKPIYTSIALVVREASFKTIGITGTRGKSTTTELIYTLLNTIYPQQILRGGNITGTSALELFDRLNSAKYLVLELSSFQLANFHQLKVSPRYSILTNLYPDHLNRYPDLSAYYYDKSAIFAYQQSDDYILVNQDNQPARELVSSASSQIIPFSAQQLPNWKLKLKGKHNRENLASVYQLAKLLQLDLDILRQVAEDFSPVPFRLELIRTVNGVAYYNDTTSTTPTATIKALQSFTQPLILILGGDTKNLPTDKLLKTLCQTKNLRHLVILGSRNLTKFISQLKQNCGDLILAQVFSMPEAVKQASLVAQSGDVVLLSPAFASFDLFNNEFDRGQQFNRAVANL